MRKVGEQTFYRGGDRILGGVCSGLAAGFHVDALWVRIAFVLLAFLQGIGLFIYVVLWLVMPEKTEDPPGGRSGFDSMTDDLRRISSEVRDQFGGVFGGRTSATEASPNASTPTGRSTSLLPGLILVLAGWFLLGAYGGPVTWGVVWPAALIVLGIVLWVRSSSRKT